MMTRPGAENNHSNRRQKAVAGLVIGISTLMFGMAFASVPLYRMFCAATGYGGTPQIVATASLQQGARSLSVRFDANVAPGLPWDFSPETESISLRTGQTATIFFKVTNKSDKPVTAQAMFNVTPENAGAFFDKISCFCFTEQKLGGHESAEMAVVFYLNPALEQDESMRYVDAITLSYTFFASKTAAPVTAASQTKNQGQSANDRPL
jgi:cytochrome c oxidase assembly protein subunit 11